MLGVRIKQCQSSKTWTELKCYCVCFCNIIDVTVVRLYRELLHTNEQQRGESYNLFMQLLELEEEWGDLAGAWFHPS